MIAMIRTKLGLSEKEVMRKSWISIQLEMADFPHYDYNAESKNDKEAKKNWLEKYKNRYNK